MNNNYLTEFAENLWNNYIKPKIEQEFTKEVSYYRATVISKNDDGTLTVKVPFDGERTINRTVALEEHIAEGDQVVICRFGNGNAANNHVVIAKAEDDEWMLGGTAQPVETEIGLRVLLGGYSVSGLVSESTLLTIRGYAAYSNSGLISISMPQVTRIGIAAFYSCTFLSSVSFPVCEKINGDSFAGCRSLKEADFPACTSLGDRSFEYCYALTTASFPVCESIGIYAFAHCSQLASVYFPECKAIGQHAFDECYSLATANFPECKVIENAAFARCSSLSTVSFQVCSSVGSNAFTNCYSLENVYLPNCSHIGSYAFENCYSLSTINLPACRWIGEGVTSGHTFRSCYSLTTVHCPVCQYIAGSTFCSCHYLVSLYLDQVSQVTTLGNSVFSYTPIGGYSRSAGRYGNVYVPSSLYEQFCSAPLWKAISSRIVPV